MSELCFHMLQKTIEKTTEDERELHKKLFNEEQFHDKYIFTEPQMYRKLIGFLEKILQADLFSTGIKLVSMTDDKYFNAIVNKTKKYAVSSLQVLSAYIFRASVAKQKLMNNE
mmetsp:Transcript_37788/g.33817  ORF Transcript_37788/g.33817 Transcript_37788/m.33817 type:complete len:113 (-) Transcript_37788:1134-1472(-)